MRVSTIQANRGKILDRNGRVLAGKGLASSVGIIPGKLENNGKSSITRIAKLIGNKNRRNRKTIISKMGER